VLIASGYSPDQFEDGGLEGAVGYVSKPYKLPVLLSAIRNALNDGTLEVNIAPHPANVVNPV